MDANICEIQSHESETEANEDKLEEYIVHLRNSILSNPQLNSPVDDEFLKMFIRARKYDIESAAKQVRKYWELRDSLNISLNRCYPSKFKGLFENMFSIFKGRHERTTVVFIRLAQWDPTKLTFDDLISMFYMVLETLIITSKETQLNGVTAIFDMKGISWNYMRYVNFRIVRLIPMVIQEAYPARFKGLHFIKHHKFFNMIYAMMKPFFKEKIRRRVVLYGHEFENRLRETFGKDFLPEFLGGDISDDSWKDMEFYSRLYEMDDYFRSKAKAGHDFLNILFGKMQENEENMFRFHRFLDFWIAKGPVKDLFFILKYSKN